jgi:adenylate cyclase
VVGSLIAALASWGVFEPFNDVAYQTLIQLRGPQSVSPEIVIIEIDEGSIDRFGKFPWPRSRYTTLIRRLDALGARAIGFGVFFAGETPDDEAFAEACRSAGNVYLPVRASYTEAGLELALPPEEIRDAAKGLGHAFVASSPDELVEGVAIDQGSADDGYFALSALMALAGLGIDPAEVLPLQDSHYQIGPLRIPVNAVGEMRINYAGGEATFERHPYADVHAPDWRARLASVEGKLVLIDVTAPKVAGSYRVPLGAGAKMARVYVQANALDTLLRQRFIWATGLPAWLYPLLLGLCGYLLSLLPGRWTPMGGLLALGVVLAVAPLLFMSLRILVDPIAAALGLVVTSMALIFWQVSRRERRLRAYAPTPLITLDQVGGSIPEGQQLYASVLFADLKSYTSLAEANEPEHLFRIVKECIQILVDEVHKAGGMIDKFTGDGVMAVFGIPERNPDDERRAVRAGLRMQRSLAEFNRRHAERLGDRPLQLRVGISAGPVFVGSLGTATRKDFTVLGDVVNVASRLEQAAEPGTVSVAEAVYDSTIDYFSFTPLGSLSLKNREELVPTYRVESEDPGR